MARSHLVVPVAPQDQEMAGPVVPGQDLHELQGGEVGPLEIVQEHHEGVGGSGEDPHEVGEDAVEPPLGLGGADVGHRGLGADQELDLLDHVGHHPSVGPQGHDQLVPHHGHPVLALGEHLADEAGEGLEDRVIREIPPELIELALAEVPAGGRDRALDLVDQGRLPDARVAGDGEDAALAARHPLELRHQPPGLGLPTVEPLGDPEPGRDVGPAELEGRAPPLGPEGIEAPAKVVLDSEGARVAVLGALLQEPTDDVGDDLGDRGRPLRERDRAARDVRMHQLRRVVVLEGDPAAGQLVEGDPQGVEVGPGVDAPVHAPRLLRGDVGQGALEAVRGPLLDPLLAEPGRDPQVDELHDPRVLVDDGVGRLDVLVDDAGGVEEPHGLGQGHPDRQELLEGHPSVGEDAVQRRGPEVLGDQRGRGPEPDQLEVTDDRVAPHRDADVEGPLVAGQLAGCGVGLPGDLDHDGLAVGDLDPAVHERATALVDERSELVSGKFGHGATGEVSRCGSRTHPPAPPRSKSRGPTGPKSPPSPVARSGSRESGLRSNGGATPRAERRAGRRTAPDPGGRSPEASGRVRRDAPCDVPRCVVTHPTAGRPGGPGRPPRRISTGCSPG